MRKYPIVSIQIFIPSEEEGRDYQLDTIQDFTRSGGVSPKVVSDIVEDAMDEAGYSEVRP